MKRFIHAGFSTIAMAAMAFSAADEGTPAAEAAPAPAPKDIKNGVTRPKDGTKTGYVWTKADEISAANGRPALREEVMAACTADGINKGTIATQYARWTEYHGVSKADRKAARDKAKADAAPAPAAELAAEA